MFCEEKRGTCTLSWVIRGRRTGSLICGVLFGLRSFKVISRVVLNRADDSASTLPYCTVMHVISLKR